MKNFIYILGGTVLTQFLVVIFSPVLSRLYSPEDFGDFALLVTLSYIFSSFFAFRLDFALLAEEDCNKKLGLISYAKYFLYINVSILAIVISLVFLFFPIRSYYLILPILVLVSVIYNIYYNYNLSLTNQKKNFIGKMIQGGGGVLSQLSFFFIFKNALGLIFGQIFGFLISIFYLDKPKKLSRKNIDLIDYKKFIYYDSINSLFRVLSNHITIILFSCLYGATASGSYYMASRVLMMPLATVSVSVSQFISSKYIAWNKLGVVKNKLTYLIKFLTISSLSFLIVVDDFIYDLFIFVLGDSWVEAASIAVISIYWLTLRFIFDCVISVFSLEDFKERITKFQFSLNFLIISIILTLFLLEVNFINVVEIISITLFLSYFFGLILFIKTFIDSFLFSFFKILSVLLILFLLSMQFGKWLDFLILICLIIYIYLNIHNVKEFLSDS